MNNLDAGTQFTVRFRTGDLDLNSVGSCFRKADEDDGDMLEV